jgi:hypothetical protein
MINGNFIEASQNLMYISSDIYEEVWNLISEEDLALYFTITFLVSFRRQILKEVVSI